MSMIRIFLTCGEYVFVEDELVELILRGIILWKLLCGATLLGITLWGFMNDLNIIPSPRVFSKYLFLFLCTYLLEVIIFICICSFNLVIGRFCNQNRESKVILNYEIDFVLKVFL